MYTLFYSPGACSLAIHALLVETGAPYRLENVSIAAGKNRSAEFIRVNPRGQVPVLVDAGGQVIREGAAIILYLCEKHPNALMPAAGTPERAKALEWLMYANSSLHPMASRIFFIGRKIADENARQIANAAAVAAFQEAWNDLDAYLATSPFLAGDTITIADVLVRVISGWTGRMSPAITFGQNVQRVFDAVNHHPAFVKAVAAEQQPANAA